MHLLEITTPATLDASANDNTLAAVESATRVPTNAEAIAADGDRSTACAPRSVAASPSSVNGFCLSPRSSREVVYVALHSGLAIKHIVPSDRTVDRTYHSRDNLLAARSHLDEPTRTYALVSDPQLTVAEQHEAALYAARVLAATETQYAPICLVEQLIAIVDHERSMRTRAEARSAN